MMAARAGPHPPVRQWLGVRYNVPGAPLYDVRLVLAHLPPNPVALVCRTPEGDYADVRDVRVATNHNSLPGIAGPSTYGFRAAPGVAEITLWRVQGEAYVLALQVSGPGGAPGAAAAGMGLGFPALAAPGGAGGGAGGVFLVEWQWQVQQCAQVFLCFLGQQRQCLV